MNEQPVPGQELEAIREQIRGICEAKRKKRKAPEPEFVPKDKNHSGHLDTQLFPNRKPLYHL